ncbi:MAG: AhpC/TSA family protein [Chamaesiphon sp.]|nr:AhpC/TSA family protein [Chamaesiphon sp.]
MDIYSIFQQTKRQRTSDGEIVPILDVCDRSKKLLVIICPQLGDFDSLEYAWWLQRAQKELEANGVTVRMVGIGDRSSGQKFCEFTKFPAEWLFVDQRAELHSQLNLYPGLSVKLPRFSAAQNAWVNLILMCAGIGSPGTLGEVFRGYKGDQSAPQLIAAAEIVNAKPLPPIAGSFFDVAGGSGFQRPFELATLRLRNMAEVLGNWATYVPDPTYLTQRGGTFLFDAQGVLLYEHRDRGILGFAANMSQPLSFLEKGLIIDN